MISREEIVNLANLSRLKLSEEEITLMQKDMGAILAYVDKLKTATGKVSGMTAGLVMSQNKNVMREDKNPHNSGIYTEKLVGAAPHHEGDYVKVKKILGSSE